MNVNVNELLQLLGAKEVELMMLRKQVEELMAAAQKEPEVPNG